MKKRLLLFGLSYFILLPIVNATESYISSDVQAKLQRIETWLPEFAWPHIKSVFSEISVNLNISEECRSSVNNCLIRPGFVSKAKQSDLGFYEQCPLTSYSSHFVEIDWPLPNSLHQDHVNLNTSGLWLDKLADIFTVYYYEKQVLMVCLPTQCSTNDYETISRDFLFNRQLPLRMKFMHDEIDIDEMAKAKLLKIASISIVLFYMAVILISTIIRSFTQSAYPLIRCLDIIENTGKIFRQSAYNRNDRLSFLNGYRFIYGYVALTSHVTMTALVQSKYTQGL